MLREEYLEEINAKLSKASCEDLECILEFIDDYIFIEEEESNLV